MKVLHHISLAVLFLILTHCTQVNSRESSAVSVFEIPEKVELDTGDFRIAYSDAAVDYLKKKISATRYPDEIKGATGTYGFGKSELQQILDYWGDEFDFSAHQERLNQWNHQIEEVDGFKLHFVHEKAASAPSGTIVLLHGWPSTFLQMAKIIPQLTKPDDTETAAFDVVAISLPGYGFSEVPTKPGMAVYSMAGLMHRLMTEKLGYSSFIVRASDIGAGVAKEWALAYPNHVMGLHLSGSNPYIYQMPDELSEAEQRFAQEAQTFMQQNGAYAALHSTEPQTLAYALNDSPAGLAAWILARYEKWTDHDGDLEEVYSKDDLLDMLTVFWMTETINGSMRSYYESAHVYSPNAGEPVGVPTAFLMLKKDIAVAPREWEARTYINIVQWQEHASGGHFAEWEVPNLVVESLRAFGEVLSGPEVKR